MEGTEKSEELCSYLVLCAAKKALPAPFRLCRALGVRSATAQTPEGPVTKPCLVTNATPLHDGAGDKCVETVFL